MSGLQVEAHNYKGHGEMIGSTKVRSIFIIILV